MNKENRTYDIGQKVELIILDRNDDESLSEIETLIESGFMTKDEVINNYQLNDENE